MTAPQKAASLKDEIDWTLPGSSRFAQVERTYGNGLWAAEPKLDGCRVTLTLGERSVLRSSRDRSDNFPHLRDLNVPEIIRGTVLDGELIAPDAKITTHTGRTTDSLLNASTALLNSNPKGAVETQRRHGNAKLYAFDVLSVGDADVRHLPYSERRALLERVVGLLVVHGSWDVVLVPQVPVTADAIQTCIEGGFEGVVLKRLSGRYSEGHRSPDWLKIKAFSTADLFIVGWKPGEGSNASQVGSVEVAVVDEEGAVVKVGSVGNFTVDFRNQITDDDGSLRPEWYGRVVEVLAQGLGRNQRMRHAHLVRLRPDKVWTECTKDQLDNFARV